jgi:cell division protein FtsQ
MFSTFKLKTWVKWALGTLVVVTTLAAVERQHRRQYCQGVQITIEGDPKDSYLTPDDLEDLLTQQGRYPVRRIRFDQLDFRRLERRIRRDTWVKTCQVSRDLTGNLLVRVALRRPLARLITPEKDRYLSDDGYLTYPSMHHTPRVVLLSGPYAQERVKHSARRADEKSLIALLNQLEADPFWRAQITQLDMAANGEITLLPQVGDHRIEIGTADGAVEKLRKLRLFYERVVPARGWATYRRVSVQFRNQIVCEKNEVPTTKQL